MTTPLWCLLGFAGWMIFLVLCLAVVRVGQVLRGKKQANEFPSGIPHGSPREWRLNRAHMNTAENLPIFATVVLVGSLAGVSGATFATLAQVCLGARMVQSIVHVSSNAVMAVNLRFAALAAQLVSFIWMGLEIAKIAR